MPKLLQTCPHWMATDADNSSERYQLFEFVLLCDVFQISLKIWIRISCFLCLFRLIIVHNSHFQTQSKSWAQSPSTRSLRLTRRHSPDSTASCHSSPLQHLLWIWTDYWGVPYNSRYQVCQMPKQLLTGRIHYQVMSTKLHKHFTGTGG